MPEPLDSLIELARGTSYESLAGDEEKLEALMLEQMKASEDPMTREIGSGIADGTMTWHAVASTTAYADYIDHGIKAMRHVDFAATFTALAAERMPNGQTTQQDEDEPFSKGVLKKRGGRKPQ